MGDSKKGWWILVAVIAICIAVVVASYQETKVFVDLKNWVLALIPRWDCPECPGCPECPEPIIEEPHLAQLARQYLGKDALIYSSRKVTYSVEDLDKDAVTLYVQYRLVVKNLSSQTRSHDFKIMLDTEYPNPVVEVDGHRVDPSETVGTPPTEKTLFYHDTIPGEGAKEVTWKLSLRKEPLPFKEFDVTLKPAIYSELRIKGSPALMNKLNVEVRALTWEDNWKPRKHYSAEETVFIWKTGYPLLPFQGGLISIKRK